jgi:hypothetical protein
VGIRDLSGVDERFVEAIESLKAVASEKVLIPEPWPPWRQPKGKVMGSLVDSHTNATRIGWHLEPETGKWNPRPFDATPGHLLPSVTRC